MAKAHTLVDNFNDNQLNTSLWNAFGDYAEVNGRVELRPTGTAGDYAGYESDVNYDLRGSEVVLELVQALRSVSSAGFDLEVIKDSASRLILSVENGWLEVQKEVADVTITITDQRYDPQRHRWLRIRERAGTVYWETSPDGEQWETLHAEAAPFAVDSVQIEFDAGCYADTAYPGVAIVDNVNTPTVSRRRRVDERRDAALKVRKRAARLAASRVPEAHANNNDEVNYPTLSYPGNYSKGLRHDTAGDPEPVSYGSMLRALESRDPADFEEIILGELPANTARVKLTNPQAGLAFELEGADTQELTQPPAPRFDSARAAHEAGELYWMAKARDVHFSDYGTSTVIAAAVTSLNNEFPLYGGPRPVSSATVFRGIFPGAQVGPYVSQFLLKGNADPRKPDGQGRDADEGYITYGSQVIDQRQLTVQAGSDHLTTFSTWLEAQNGKDLRGGDVFDTTGRKFIRNLRDGANYVHFDQPSNAFYNAAFILMSEPTGTQSTGVGAGRPMVDLEFPKDQGNPYDPPGTSGDSRTQAGFATFGPLHLLQALIDVQGRAARAVWWQKWGVHRRLRPEEYGGRVHNHLKSVRTYPLHTSILTSLQSGGLSAYYPSTGTYLLPQAFAEGAPTHPAYGAGHATISGACITILKAFFDDTKAIENPVVANSTGTALVAYTGADATQMTVGSELNKLASNISLFRNAGGVHWRSDDTESQLLGERIAIRLLQEMSLTFNEDDAYFQLTRLDGRTIRIHDGIVDLDV